MRNPARIESYTDYFHADQFVEFSDGGVKTVEPFACLINEHQCQFQRFEIRWDGISQIQIFSVTKDGLAVLMETRQVPVCSFEQTFELSTLLIDSLCASHEYTEPRYLILEREKEGGLQGRKVTSRVYWDGHDNFRCDIGWSMPESDENDWLCELGDEALVDDYLRLVMDEFSVWPEEFFLDGPGRAQLEADKVQLSSRLVTEESHHFEDVLDTLNATLSQFDGFKLPSLIPDDRYGDMTGLAA